MKMKVIEILKAVDARKKEVKAVSFQALEDDVSIREDEYQYDDLIECSSQRTIFGAIKTRRPMDKFAQQTLEELTAGFAKTKQTTMDSNPKEEEKGRSH